MLSGYFPDPDYDFEEDAMSALQVMTDPFLPSAASPVASQEIHPTKPAAGPRLNRVWPPRSNP